MDKNVEKAVSKMLEENPGELMMWMMIQMGKMVFDTNAGEAIIKQESDFGAHRYEVKAKITLKKVKPPHPPQRVETKILKI